VYTRTFEAASFSSVPVHVFVNTSVEQKELFSSNVHLDRNSATNAMHLDCTSVSAFDLQLRGSNIAQQQLHRFSASATGDASRDQQRQFQCQ
jgi:hypothetical protein